MNPLAILFLVGLAVASDVIDLSDENFESTVNSHDIILVEFFAPWCGHCKRLAPEYETAATALKKNDPPVPLAKVDCAGPGKDSCSKHGVSGYPTLKIFRSAGSDVTDYSGPRESNGIIAYMKKQAGPVSKELKSEDELKKFTSDFEASVVGFFDDGSDLHSQFLKVANKLAENFRFAHTFNKDLMKSTEFSDTVVLYRPSRLANKFEDNLIKLTGSPSDLESFLKDNAMGMVGHRTQNNHNDLKKPLLVAYYDLDYVKNVKGSNYWRNRVMKVVKKFKDAGKAIFAAVSSKKDFAGDLEQMGLKVDSDKPVVGVWDNEGRRFPMTDEFSVENLEKFVESYLNGNVEPHIKSEPIPSEDEDDVKVLVAKNFKDVVEDPDKDVFIEFYAPWCGHCKNLAPVWSELATKFKGVDHIVIAKMDATANDVPPSFNVRGFPTLYFSPAGKKDSPVPYEGGRTLEDFVKYLKTKTSKPFDAKVEL